LASEIGIWRDLTDVVKGAEVGHTLIASRKNLREIGA
jgi:hypothetical protein